jgi:hypothetical protein
VHAQPPGVRSTTLKSTGSATELVNLTPHQIDIMTPAGRIAIAPSAQPARLVSEFTNPIEIDIDGVRIAFFRELPLPTVGLPDADAYRRCLYIVSRAVAERYPERTDLVFPSRFVADPDTGRVLGCSSLSRLWEWGPE